jgi:GT2 family glycosyltransferase
MTERDGLIRDVPATEAKCVMNLVVAIATAGRRDILTATIDQIAGQSRLPDRLFVCPAGDDDIDPDTLRRHADLVRVIRGPRGLTHQRNAIVHAALDADLIVFFDDDFFPQQHFLAETEKLFLRNPDLVIATGKVLADGIKGPGLSVAEGLAHLAADPGRPGEVGLVPVYNGYGCNMAVRLAPMRLHGILFDEALPLYAWWEDVDFSRRLAPYGLIARSERLRGVHLGSKRGRTPGRRLGYSQVANLAYLIRKGSISSRVGLSMISKNISANLLRSLFPEKWVDRRGRLIGNFAAIRDILRKIDSPLNILKMD